MTDHKPTLPEVIERFEAYYTKPGNGAWGSLHVVLDDNNLEDIHVRGCVEFAEGRGDEDGAALGHLLLRLSKTQRGKINKMIRIRAQRRGTGQ